MPTKYLPRTPRRRGTTFELGLPRYDLHQGQSKHNSFVFCSHEVLFSKPTSTFFFFFSKPKYFRKRSDQKTTEPKLYSRRGTGKFSRNRTKSRPSESINQTVNVQNFLTGIPCTFSCLIRTTTNIRPVSLSITTETYVWGEFQRTKERLKPP